VTLQIKKASNNPVITVDNVPFLESDMYTARVTIYRDHSFGLWTRAD
jgi:hypothetical protein